MANTLLSVFRRSFALNSIAKFNVIGVTPIYSQKMRTLYSKSTLGLDTFKDQSEKIKLQMANIAEKFKEKMESYATEESKSMIFTEDLKNMIHIAESDEDVELVIKMLKKYTKQNQSLRFGNYVFGPVVMRMFYTHNKPDLAYECFKSEDLTSLFDQYMSYQILLDLLYENQMYDQLLDTVNIIKEKQIEGFKYPRNVIVLAFAACYKLNSKESLDFALKLWSNLHETGHYPMRRATTFCAGLALNQGKPDVALEILASAKNPYYTTIRNLKVAALAEIGRLDDIIPILKTVVNEDIPQGQSQVHTFNKEVLEKIKKIISESGNSELLLEFNRLEQIFQSQGNISESSLDEQLCSEIQKPPVIGNKDYRNQFQERRHQNRPGGFGYTPRPGLKDLV